MAEEVRLAASAIVLAGGRSSRFGADKLAAELEGEPLLHRSIRAVASVCDEVLVVGAPSGLTVSLPGDVGAQAVVVLDVELYEGPLVALVDAARRARHDRVLLVAGDMPDLQPPILRRLLAWQDGHAGACLSVDGWTQPFPMALERDLAVENGSALRATGVRSLRRLIESLSIEILPEDDWRVLDPDARSLRDVDRPEDLRAIS